MNVSRVKCFGLTLWVCLLAYCWYLLEDDPTTGESLLGSDADTFPRSQAHAAHERDAAKPKGGQQGTNLSEYPYDVDKCPACYGTSVCDQVENGNIRLRAARSIQDGVFLGRFHSTIIVGKTLLNQSEFRHFDEAVRRTRDAPLYHNTESDKRTWPAEAEIKLTGNQFSVDYVKAKLRTNVFGRDRRDWGPVLCATQRFVDAIWKLYAEKQSGADDMTTHSNLMTSLMGNAEGLLLKFFSSLDNISWPFPRYLGECGRVIITEYAGLPLTQFYNASWEERARLALEIFDVIDAFQSASGDWLLFLTDLHPGNFAVTSSGGGRVVMIDVEDVVIIDKRIADRDHTWTKKGHPRHANREAKPCNLNCFTEFSLKLPTDPDHVCPTVPEYLDYMYFSVCRDLMTNYSHERKVSPENVKEDSIQNISSGGLLNNPPREIQDKLNNLLSKCVTETVRGDRMESVEDIRNLLRKG